jgi:hypothetical protein
MVILTQEELFWILLHMAAGVTGLDGAQGHDFLRL